MSVSLIHLCRLFIISFKLRSWTLACVCRDQHFALMANKQTTFSCLQAVLTLTLADTVPLYFPVHQAMNTAQNTHVKTLNHFAVPLDRVRAKEICQSNNEADVVVNLSVKFTQQTCGNYLYYVRTQGSTTKSSPSIRQPRPQNVSFSLAIHN